MPGVSSRSSPVSMLIHWRPRVTPGLSPAIAALRFATLLINVDLPTFGMLRIITLSGRPTCPFASYSFNLSLRSFPYRRDKAVHSPAALRVSLKDSKPLLLEALLPARGQFRIRKVAAVEYDKARLRLRRAGPYQGSGWRTGCAASSISHTASTSLTLSLDHRCAFSSWLETTEYSFFVAVFHHFITLNSERVYDHTLSRDQPYLPCLSRFFCCRWTYCGYRPSRTPSIAITRFTSAFVGIIFVLLNTTIPPTFGL